MPDNTASLTDREMELLEAFAESQGLSVQEALKKACIKNLEQKFNIKEPDVRPFKSPRG